MSKNQTRGPKRLLEVHVSARFKSENERNVANSIYFALHVGLTG